MKKLGHTYLPAFYPAAKKWWKDRHADDAAALAFYSLISLVPLLLVSVFVASFVVKEEVAKQIIIEETNRVAGKSIAEYFASMLHSDVNWAGSGLSPIFAGLIILFSATKMLSELRKSLAKVFGKKEEAKKKKIYSSVISRLVSVSMLVSLGIIVVSAVAIETIIGILTKALPDASLWVSIASWLSPIASFAGVTLLAALTMRWLPEKRPKMSEALAGGIVSAILLILLKYGVTITITHTDIGSYYGSAFTLVMVLFWVYFTMQVFLYGAEYAAELARRKQNKTESQAKPVSSNEVPQKRDPFLS